MTRKLPLRWRLVLVSWCLALATVGVLGSLLYLRAKRHVLQQLEKSLETRCDEVITVLQSAAQHPSLEDFLAVETTLRNSPAVYFYEIRDGAGGIVARSQNLHDVELAVPEAWEAGRFGHPISLQTTRNPVGTGGERIRLRTERVVLRRAGGEPTTYFIQTAVSLGAHETAMRQTLHEFVAVAIVSLGAVLLLLWFVTSRALQPVAVMTRKASAITASNLRERIPPAGRDDELDELANVLNDMLERLGASLRQMEQFSSGAAHQLRTPLTRIRGELDLVLRGEVPGPVRSQLERIREELEVLSRLCARLLLLAQIEQHAAPALLDESVELEEVVAELHDQMTPVAQERGVTLRRTPSLAPARIKGSRQLLVQALLNLLANAIRHTPRGGRVEVTTERNGQHIRLSVVDEGPGVPDEERARIFEPFYRIPSASAISPDDGSGLGLAIVKAIAHAHGGRVELRNAPERGCVFSLVLPAWSG